MGFTPVIWTGFNGDNFDTNDRHVGAGTVSSSGVLAAFENILADATQLSTGFIVLAHDLYQQSVDLATRFMGIIECLGQPLSNAYKETNNNTTNPAPSGVSQAHSYSGAAATASSSTHSGAEKTSSLVGGLVAAMALPALGLLL